jgi:release factor glutamine methyltransferase
VSSRAEAPSVTVRSTRMANAFGSDDEGQSARIEALVRLGRTLRDAGYEFIAVTPETHRRVDARAAAAGRLQARSLRDAFGWNRPFDPALLPPEVMRLAREASVIRPDGALLRATVRFATLGGRVFVHSAHPTVEADAVFFGPDTYRYCALITEALAGGSYRRVVDVGTGSGVGGIVAASNVEQIVLADINPAALVLARTNAILAGVDSECELLVSDVLAGLTGPIDVVIANPPYLVDPSARTYRHGGGMHGEELAIRIAREALERLEPKGKLVLYTGAAVVEGEDVFERAVRPLCESADVAWEYRELDPDVFGEEIELNDAYADVERIAAVGLVATKR